MMSARTNLTYASAIRVGRSRLDSNDRVESTTARLISSFERACVSPLAGRFAPGKIAQKRTVKLPRIEFLNRRIGINKRSLRNAKKIERAVEVPSVGRAAHVHITV